jgi:hypothetical protein
MNPDDPFDRYNLIQAEQLLMAQEIAREYFKGELYHRDGARFGGITIEQPDGATINLDEAETGRLFMIWMKKARHFASMRSTYRD